MRRGKWADIGAATHAAMNRGKPCAAGCGWPVDPASTKDADGTPVYDRHPGCEPGGQQLRLIEGGKAA